MTKSTITDERITSVIERLEHYACNLKWTNVRGAQDLLTAADGLRELQERRKATMNSEPVILYRERNPYNGLTTGWQELTENEFSFIKENAGENAEFLTLYRHAQPAPVVPEEKSIPNTLSMYAVDAVAAIAEVKGWNACRAAMLQELKKSAGTEAICRSDENVQVLHTKSPAQSDCCPAQNHVSPEQNGDTPAQSQGWIPVSEQMPEDRTQVILWDAEIGEVTSGHYSHKTHTFYHCGDTIENEITHWMAPPAAPQEVSDA